MKQLVEDKSLQKKIDIRKYVSAEVGMPTLTDIMAELDKPGLDPRGEVEKFEFDASIKEIEDLQVGMVVPGIVTIIILIHSEYPFYFTPFIDKAIRLRFKSTSATLTITCS